MKRTRWPRPYLCGSLVEEGTYGPHRKLFMQGSPGEQNTTDTIQMLHWSHFPEGSKGVRVGQRLDRIIDLSRQPDLNLGFHCVKGVVRPPLSSDESAANS